MNTDNSTKLRIHKLISILMTLIGISLMTFMVIIEDEPGAIPLLLIVVGAGGYIITRHSIRSQHERV